MRRDGLEPGETGRQLEQQRAELSVGESQQQQPGQQEQQPWVPPFEFTPTARW